MEDVRQDEDWLFLRRYLPEDLDVLAKQSGALRRRRQVRSGEDLLRLALVYACEGVSLRDVSAWCRETGFSESSDVAILKRLRACPAYLRQIVSRLLDAAQGPCEPLQLKLLDSTTLSRARAKGVDFRVHVGYDLKSGCISGIELTDGSIGDRLNRVPVRKGEVVVGDMGYNGREPFWDVVKEQGHLLVRTHPKLSSFLDADLQKVDLLEWAKGIEPGKIQEMAVATRPYREAPAMKGRLIAVTASARSRHARTKQVARRAQRNGKKASQLQVEAGKYIFLFTTLEARQASAESVLNAYRLRWQIEMLFKRIKGILTLGELRAKDKLLCETLILAKLALLLLSQKIEQDFSPWGYPMPKQLATT